MDKYKCLIVEDEVLAQNLLKNYLSKIPDIEVAGTCQTAMEALSFIKNETIDILLLDIQMPDLTGIELMRAIQDPPLTILITAYSEYALEGYELNVVDYLLKPVKFDRFFMAIAKVLELLNQKKLKKDNSSPDTDIALDYIFVKSGYKAIKVRFEEILYIESLQKYVQFKCKDTQVTTLMSLSKLDEILPTKDFLRIQKSFIANLNHIAGIEGNRLIMINKDKIPISKSIKPYLIQLLDKNKLL
ncbi:LytR/AlgR family response regulator transcription factor [Spongiimicrobium sp. 3-5]|uniref:LytR/AlgR family response regulator transcription factor n=1 Tax=Spongiimicrobium sp. 3-5 TaxID=3332596 RepID=UPI003980D044